MNRGYRESIQRVNFLYGEQNALYHQAALRMGLTDSALFVLYVLHCKEGSCPLGEICRESGLSKQTINSTLRRLEADGVLYLEQDGGRTKRVCLTEQGTAYAARTGGRLLEAEGRAFADWTEAETALYLKLMEKYNQSFGAQLETL